MMRYMVLGLLVLAGCSGRSDGADVGARADQAAALLGYWTAQNVSDPQLLPRSDRATFQGLTTLGLPIGTDGADYVGDMTVTIRFGSRANRVSGTIDDIDGLDGTLAIGNGFLDRGADVGVDYTFGADVTGNLAQDDASYSVEGEILGDLHGRSNEGMTGIIFGAVTGPDGQALFDGTFAGEVAD